MKKFLPKRKTERKPSDDEFQSRKSRYIKMINENDLVLKLISHKNDPLSGRIKGFEIKQAALPTYLLACTNK